MHVAVIYYHHNPDSTYSSPPKKLLVSIVNNRLQGVLKILSLCISYYVLLTDKIFAFIKSFYRIKSEKHKICTMIEIS
jgi:hypothetical protein